MQPKLPYQWQQVTSEFELEFEPRLELEPQAPSRLSQQMAHSQPAADSD